MYFWRAVIVLVLTGCSVAYGQTGRASGAKAGQKHEAKTTWRALPSKAVIESLISREKDLAAAEQRHAVAVIDEALAEDFHELSAEGRLYSKAEILPMLNDVKIEDYMMSDFQAFPLSAECVILTYRSTVKGNYKGEPFPSKLAVSSVWVRRHGSWRVAFHQGTPLAEK